MDELLMPFSFPAMQTAFWVAAILAIPSAILSCFLVIKGWSLMGDAVSHAVLPGIVLAYIAGIPLILGAFVAGMVCATSIGFLENHSRLKRDTLMGVVFSGMFGFGLVIYTQIETNLHLDHILFGNILGIYDADFYLALGISVFVSAVLLLKWRDFLLHAFDPVQAKTLGLPVIWLHYGLLSLLCLTVIATLKAVGLILAIGLLITPGATAFLLTKRFSYMIGIAILLTSLAMFSGVYASFWIGSDIGPTIILILTAFFGLAFLWNILKIKQVRSKIS